MANQTLIQAYDAQSDALQLTAVLQQPRAVRAQLWQRFCAQAGVPRGALQRSHIDALDRLAHTAHPSGQLDLPGGLRARKSYNALHIGRARATQVPPPVQVFPGQTVRWGVWEIAYQTGRQPQGWHFAADAIDGPVTVRARQVGDRFCPARHHTTVKKWMIAQKIPQNLRDTTPILCDNKGILAVADLACDRRRAALQSREYATICCRRVRE